MNNDRYIEKLKKALARLGNDERDEIIMEIQSDAAESGKSLQDRFGTPDELAARYLEGEPLKPAVKEQVSAIGKKVLLWAGVTVLLLLVIAVFAFRQLSEDDFDYADESAPELNLTDSIWNSIDWHSAVNIEVIQSKVVFYWHQSASIRWSCKGGFKFLKANKKSQIRHANCLVFLPLQETTISVNQGRVVIVRPQVSLDISVEQGALQIAENGEQYRYELSGNHSHVAGLTSHDNANTSITISATEADVALYEYP